MVQIGNPDPIRSKRKAISALFPYAALREREGQGEMLDLITHLARVSTQSGFMWHRIGTLVTALLDEESPISSKRAAILALPHMPWRKLTNAGSLVRQWELAASAVPYADDIGQSVVDTLLQIASLDSISPHISVTMWSWLNKRPSLHPISWGRHHGTHPAVVRTIRALGDIEVLKSYLFLVWSEWDDLRPGGSSEMNTSIRGCLSGVRMEEHRQDLLRRLDHILRELGMGLERLRRYKPSLDEGAIQRMKGEYGGLKKVLLEADTPARVTPTRESSPQVNYPFPVH